MSKIISLFNHKGGVSKTTTSFHLASMLVSKGNRVLLVDTDSQCNLTGLVLGEDYFEGFYQSNINNNIKAALDPAFQGKPTPITTIEGVEKREGLLLVPGHIDITELDISLGMAHNFSSSMPVLLNLPGAIYCFINKMANEHKADYVVIDMNPSLSEINKNILMISDYFIIPTAPDFFSQMAIDTLTNTLPRWKKWSETAKLFFKDSEYPFPNKTPKFLGTVMQRFTIRNGKASSAFQEKIDEVNEKINLVMVPALNECDMLLEGGKAQKQKELDFCLANIPDFMSLVTKMLLPDGAIPVFDIPDENLGTGTVRDNNVRKRDTFFEQFSSLTDYVLFLTK